MWLGGKYNCIVVLGPTASGKTRLAVKLAAEFQGEVISADSRQVYKHLDIGTGKDLHEYITGSQSVPYHLIDIADPSRQFYLHEFSEKLLEAFRDITDRDKLPVICGGTGLYLDALRKDLSYTQVPENQMLRTQLQKFTKPQLLEKLEGYKNPLVSKVDKTSVKRIIRGIEIAEYLQFHVLKQPEPLPYRPLYIGIQLPTPELHKRIRQRLDSRIEAGMIDEVKGLIEHGINDERLRSLGLEYRLVAEHLAGEISLVEMRAKLFTAIRQYAKRQMTWFRKMQREGVSITWLSNNNLTGALLQEIKEKLILSV